MCHQSNPITPHEMSCFQMIAAVLHFLWVVLIWLFHVQCLLYIACSFLSKSAACSFCMISHNAISNSVSSSHFMPEPCSSFLTFSLYFLSKRVSLSLTGRVLTVNLGTLSPFKVCAISPQISPLSLLCFGCLAWDRAHLTTSWNNFWT